MPGVPSIVAEYRTALAALLEHLIVDHRLSRLAFINGPRENPDAKSRWEVFQNVLTRHGLSVDESLVEDGMFTLAGGEDAVYRLIGKGAAFDGVVCANDAMALGALEALRALGHLVPRDLALTGFDDVVQSRISSPALTTIRQPIDAMAALAVRTVYDQLCGRQVPERVELPCEFLPRKSCGCTRLANERSIRPSPLATSGPAEFVAGHSARLAKLLERAVRVHRNVYAEWAAPLVESLISELRGNKEMFLVALEELLDRSAVHNDIFEDFQAAITLLREELGPIMSPELESLWHDARRLVAVANTRAHVRQRMELDRAYSTLLHCGEQLSTALTADRLRGILAEELPRMGVANAFLYLRKKANKQDLEPFFGVCNGRSLDVDSASFDVRELVPSDPQLDQHRHSWFVLPLTFESESLGVAVLEFESGLTHCEMLREQIGTALNNIELHAEIVRRTALHERSVQERLATADRMRSLSLLAGGVAHDLNNALGPLVALPDIIGTELDELMQNEGLQAPMIRADLTVIKAASLRAARTIRDLLTLGRQGHTEKETFDLNVAIANWFENENPHRNSPADRRSEIILELASAPLAIYASEAHVIRAIANLVQNALEALDGQGRVTLSTYQQVLPKGASGFEAIDPGDYVVVAVTDTGNGIVREDLPRVFEPFFSKKRLDDTSGSGLGLAIVHGVVKEHNGFVDVRSVVGKGTEFLLYFRRAHEPPRESARGPSRPVQAVRILVIDDDPVQLRTATRVLSRQGHSVIAMSSGLAAYAEFVKAVESSRNGQPPIDVVIVDMLLNEDEDGLTIFQKIKALFPSIHGIVVSGHSPTERTLAAVNGGLGWLSKPYTAAGLAESVKRVLG